MRKTIKQLEAQIAELENSKSHWYNKFTELKDKDDKYKNSRIELLENENHNLHNKNDSLLEIIRWHINPSTAESPFMPTKSQRDERNKNNLGY